MGALPDDVLPAPPCAIALAGSPAPATRRHVHRRRPQPRVPTLSATARRGLAGIVVARLAVNGGIRVVYPFLAVIAHGLGVPFGVLALLVAARSLAGLAAPALVRLVPAHRERTAMLSGLGMVVGGCAMIVASGVVTGPGRALLVGVGFATTGLARPLFELPMQTWVSANVSVHARGRALGITELGWALSLAVTVPVAGVLIDRVGWRTPFLLVGGLAVLGVLALLVALPADAPGWPLTPGRPSVLALPVRLTRLPTTRAICVGAGLAVAAGEVVLIVYGRWLGEDLGLSVAQIGVSTLVIVLAELAGEGIVVLVSDRLGLCRTLFTALGVSLVAYGALGLVGGRVALAWAVIVTLFVAFEMCIGALIAFASVTARQTGDRARLLGRLMAAVACGNAAGAVLAPLSYRVGGIALAGGVSAATAAAALVVLWVGSRPVAPTRVA